MKHQYFSKKNQLLCNPSWDKFLLLWQIAWYRYSFSTERNQSRKSKPLKNTKVRFQQLMDYLEIYPDACIWYHTSGMQLHIHKDVYYLVFPKARSGVAGFYHLINTPHTSDIFFRNGIILFKYKTLRHVVASAA